MALAWFSFQGFAAVFTLFAVIMFVGMIVQTVVASVILYHGYKHTGPRIAPASLAMDVERTEISLHCAPAASLESDAWYLYDGAQQEEPFTREDLMYQLRSFGDLGSVSVWCQGYDNWRPATDVFDPARLNGLNSESAPTYKWRYALYGLLVGLTLSLSDYFLQWRGNRFLPWEGDGIAENIGYVARALLSPAVIGFIVGFFRDLGRSRPTDLNAVRRNPYDRTKDTPNRTQVTHNSARRTNFMARSWRGEYSLAATYWGFAFFGNFAAGLVPVLVATVLLSKTDYDPHRVLATMMAIWLGVAAIGVWQTVAVWRSANRHIDARIALGKKSPWAGVAKLLVILGFMRLIGEFITSGLPQLTEASRMAFLDDPDIPAYSIRVMRNGTEAEIVGRFKYGLTDDFEKIFSASRQIKVVHLDSFGGRIGEAIRLNGFMREKGLSTYVSAECYSACTVAFAGGRTRILRKAIRS